jgi:glycosyltransferase involved in cell wall biosynthesis
MRVAIVHDYLTELGGAERVLEAICELFPHAPIYTLIYDKKATGGIFEGRRIHTSFLQRFPFSRRRHRNYAWLMPMAVEGLDLSKYDLVVSDSSSYAKGVITKPNTIHVCYCHTPIRYAWDDSHRYVKEFGAPRIFRWLIPLFLNYLRIWDKEAALRVDWFATNSSFVRDRIRKYYRVDAEVVHPPVDTDFFSAVRREAKDYFLAAGRLVAYKRFDLAIKACNEMKLKLVVAGEGPEEKKLRKIAGPEITFAGRVSDEKLRELYAGAKALIFPQEEDFGIIAVEAMAAGCPVIAYRGGGALENIIEGVTGTFFDHERPSTLAHALEEFDNMKFDPEAIRRHAENFSKSAFKKNIMRVIEKALGGADVVKQDSATEKYSLELKQKQEKQTILRT